MKETGNTNELKKIRFNILAFMLYLVSLEVFDVQL